MLRWASVSQKVSTISRKYDTITAPRRTFTCYHCSLTYYQHLLLLKSISCNRSWSAKPDVWLCINVVYGKAKEPILSSHSNPVDSALQLACFSWRMEATAAEERPRGARLLLSLCFLWAFLSDRWMRTTRGTWRKLSSDGRATRRSDLFTAINPEDTRQHETTRYLDGPGTKGRKAIIIILDKHMQP